MPIPLEHATDQLLAPDRRPVLLPSDEGGGPSPSLTVWLAVFVLAAAVIGGAVYQQLWVDVGGEVARLVPASAPVYVKMPSPFEQLERALALDRFAAPEELRHTAQTSGPLADGAVGALAGVPLPALRRLLVSADAVRLVTQPSPRGTSALLFFEIPGERERRVLRSQLAPLLATTGRTMGHPIESFLADGGPLPWTDDALRARLVELEPHIVLGFGPEDGVEELIQARVTGRSQPVARREGFDVESDEVPVPLRAALDPAWAADVARPLVERVVADPIGFRLSVVDRVGSIAISDDFVGSEERVSVRLTTRADAVTEAHRPALRGATHPLLRGLPARPRLAVGVSLASLDAGLGAMAELLPAAAALLADAEGPGERSLIARFASATSTAASSNLDRTMGGEVVLFLPADDPSPLAWRLAVSVDDSAAAEGVLESMVAAVLGPEWRYGTVFGEGAAWHVAERDHPPADAPTERVVWRVLDRVAVFAPDVAALESIAAWSRDGGAAIPVVERALRALPSRAPVVVLADVPTVARASPPGLDVVTSRLRQDFLFSAAVRLAPDTLELVTNTGAFTALAALAATDHGTLETLGASDLSPSCTGVLQWLCRTRPLAFLCEPFGPGNRARLAAACARAR
ncbi:MAG: hypothetical protein H6744_04000 [Deltaproteobacteria bacterium]|nr:hypothetical protein [Deltaproteobacteria bacterium]MCB9785840.1 hypothetical protein [Deltaproteobacteria bacterium]